MTKTAHIDYGITPIKCGSVCSGIEAFSVGAEGLPFDMRWLSEIERFPCSVLAHRIALFEKVQTRIQGYNDDRINEKAG